VAPHWQNKGTCLCPCTGGGTAGTYSAFACGLLDMEDCIFRFTRSGDTAGSLRRPLGLSELATLEVLSFEGCLDPPVKHLKHFQCRLVQSVLPPRRFSYTHASAPCDSGGFRQLS
jgi:hypothetical protein